MSPLAAFNSIDQIVDEQIVRLARDPLSFPAQFHLFRGDAIVVSVERIAAGDELDALVGDVALHVAEEQADAFIAIFKGRVASGEPGTRSDIPGIVVERPEAPLVWVPCIAASAHARGVPESVGVVARYEVVSDHDIRVLERRRHEGSGAIFRWLDPIMRVWAEEARP